MKYLAILAVAAALLVSCGGDPPIVPAFAPAPTTVPVAVAPTAVPTCQDLAASYIKQVEPLAREWDDATTLANSTPRASLADQIAKLQDIQRRSEALEAPVCAATVQQSFVGQMSATNRAFVAFLGQSQQTSVDDLFALASEQQIIFKTELPHLKAGQPIGKADPPFTDGLGATMAALQAPYEKAGQMFKQRSLTDGTTASDATTPDNLTTIEFIGTPDKVRKAFFVTAMSGYNQARVNAMKASLHQMLQSVAPDWAKGSAWLDAAIGLDKAGRQVTANRGRVIAFDYESAGGNDTYTLSIEVP